MALAAIWDAVMVSAAMTAAVTDPAASLAVLMAPSVICVPTIWPVSFAAAMAANWESLSCPVTCDAATEAIWAAVNVPEMSAAGTVAT